MDLSAHTTNVRCLLAGHLAPPMCCLDYGPNYPGYPLFVITHLWSSQLTWLARSWGPTVLSRETSRRELRVIGNAHALNATQISTFFNQGQYIRLPCSSCFLVPLLGFQNPHPHPTSVPFLQTSLPTLAILIQWTSVSIIASKSSPRVTSGHSCSPCRPSSIVKQASMELLNLEHGRSH